MAWLESLTGEVAITAVTLAEPLAGVRRLPDGHRKSSLRSQLKAALEPYRNARSILPFDHTASEQYAEVLALREATGAPISTADAQIAAICRAHHAACATRNSRDFAGTGVENIDPWRD